MCLCTNKEEEEKTHGEIKEEKLSYSLEQR